MKKLILSGLLTIVGCLPFAHAQIINQDASGNSTIVTPGTSISLNITQTQIQGSHYGFLGAGQIWMYGIDLSANNSTGVASLFDNGKFSPGAAINGLIGVRLINVEHDPFSTAKSTATNNLAMLLTALDQRYTDEVTLLVSNSGLSLPDKITVEGELSALDNNVPIEYLPLQLVQYKSAVADAGEILIINDIVKQLTAFIAINANAFDAVKLQRALLAQIHAPMLLRNTTLLLYLRTGYSANQFTYDQGSTFSDYSKRFTDTTGKTWSLEIGTSYQFTQNFLGSSVGYSHQDNMSALTSADYNYSYQDTAVTSGKLTKEKAFTAYSGKYGYYGKLYLNIDYQHLFTLDTSKYLAIGPYLRWNHDLNATGLATDATVLGVSFNYLNGKSGAFLGGIYVQSDDISGRTEPQFSKSIQFGLVAKFNLGSIFILK